MGLQAGTRLGSYAIVGPIGAGGMGEVYRARDTRLNRDVAIKVLPELFAADPDRLARFEREAKSVAQLSHPNILGIFDFGRDGTTAYAVMELLVGDTLRQRLSNGGLSSRKAIEYGVQIAQGLAAAHDKGIAHRDLKPENLFITGDDRVKILDFGLAKPLASGISNGTMDTIGTAAGTVMGTVGYMAPEQVRGQATDHRADIFSFGAVLYEMITGQRPFRGDTPADTISAILNSEPPDLESVTGGVPPALDRIARRCLEKKPELRFQSAHDLAFALETVSARGSGAVSTAVAASVSREGRRVRVPALAAILVIVAAAAAIGGWMLGHRSVTKEPAWQHFRQITDAAGEETAPTISPDGNTIAYATHAKETWDIYAQRVGGSNSIAIAADPERDESGPAFSPEGLSIAYYESDQDGGIFVAGATGESARRLTTFGVHPAWSPDGTQIVFSTEEIGSPYTRPGQSTLWVIGVSGGEPQRIDGTGDAAQPSWAPGGRRVAYWSNTNGQRDVYTIAVGGGTRTAVVEDAAVDWCPVWSPDGRFIYFGSDRGGSMNIWRIRLDENTGKALGAPEPVTSGVQASAEQPGFSKSGSRLAFRSRVGARNPIALAFDPVTLRAGTPVVLDNSNSIRYPSDATRDGRRLAFGNLGEGREDVFTSAADGSGMRRVTDDEARDRAPVWTPDGKSLFFYSNRSGQWAIWSIGADGGGLRKVAALPDAGLLYPLLSPAGDRLVFSTPSEVYTGSAAPGGTAEANARKLPGTQVDGNAFRATSWSPDGTRLVGWMQGPTGRRLAVAVYDLAASKIARQFPGGTGFIRWLPDARHVCYFTQTGEALMVLDTVSGVVRRVEVRLPLRASGEIFAVAPDGRTIYYGGIRSEADIWIVERQ